MTDSINRLSNGLATSYCWVLLLSAVFLVNACAQRGAPPPVVDMPQNEPEVYAPQQTSPPDSGAQIPSPAVSEPEPEPEPVSLSVWLDIPLEDFVPDQPPPVESGHDTLLLGIASDAARALINRAKQAQREKQFEKSNVYLERALRIEPGNAVIYLYLARLRFLQGDPEQGKQLASRGLRHVSPDSFLRQQLEQLVTSKY